MQGWQYYDDKWYYMENNQRVRGWKYFTEKDGEKKPHWSYFDKKTGALYTGWHYMGSDEGETTRHWSYFGKNGWLRTGWVWLTQKEDGEAVDHWSYFGANGWLRTGWVQFGKGTAEPDGGSAKHWSFFGANGWLRKGLIWLGAADGEKTGHYSYFENNGWLVTNKEVTVGNKKYKADAAGWLTEISYTPVRPATGVTYSKFISNHAGKAMDYDGVAGAQCVDLAKFYLYEVFGIKPGSWGHAYAYYDEFYSHKELVDNFTRIANTADFVPKKGDILVWKKALNGAYGHIAIASGVGNTDYFESYDQNWTGCHDACTRIRHSYKYLAGVLRPKNQSKCA